MLAFACKCMYPTFVAQKKPFATQIDEGLLKAVRKYVEAKGLRLCSFVESALRAALKESK